MAMLPIAELTETIKDAGCYNQKAIRLKNLTGFLMKKELDFFGLTQMDTLLLRQELLQMNGIGKETADSILLYALRHRIFVVDAYTKRLFSRLRFPWMAKSSYDEIQAFFQNEIPQDAQAYNELHALIVFHSKYYCRVRPNCSNCLIREDCQQNQ